MTARDDFLSPLPDRGSFIRENKGMPRHTTVGGMNVVSSGPANDLLDPMIRSRSAKLGALCWIFAAPLFLAANFVVGLAWERPRFSWMTNNISDLGNVNCGVWDTTRPRYVCSPWHDAMNIAMVLTALLLFAGLVLTWRACGDGRAIRTGQRMLLLWTIGLGLAGLFPADTHENLHFLGAVLIFGPGNLGLVVAGFARRGTLLGRSRFITLGLGLLGFAGSVFFIAQQGLGIGLGTMERVAVFALPVWAFCIGIQIVIAHGRKAQIPIHQTLIQSAHSSPTA